MRKMIDYTVEALAKKKDNRCKHPKIFITGDYPVEHNSKSMGLDQYVSAGCLTCESTLLRKEEHFWDNYEMTHKLFENKWYIWVRKYDK